MPLYLYKCEDCGEVTEKLVRRLHLAMWSLCPHCSGNAKRIPATCNWSFGWRLSDRSHERFGPRDEYVPNV